MLFGKKHGERHGRHRDGGRDGGREGGTEGCKVTSVEPTHACASRHTLSRTVVVRLLGQSERVVRVICLGKVGRNASNKGAGGSWPA